MLPSMICRIVILFFACTFDLSLARALPVEQGPRIASSHAKPVVSLRNGSYYGYHLPKYSQDVFLGMPFAQAPIGDLRYRVPQSLNTTWHNTKNATEYGFACIGYGEDTTIGDSNYVSEDCLTINVIKPIGYEHQKLPVGVWIYGGGWYEGSSRDPRYNLSYIVQQSVKIDKPFIGVSFNYRLHGWGYLWSREIVDAGVANLGLRDQYKALEWVQENIESFGGDHKKVTIWGQSAGAASVGNLMLAYNGRDDHLFSAAISQSGPLAGIGIIEPYPELSEQLYENITRSTNCVSEQDKLACLRSLSTEQLNATLFQIAGESNTAVDFGPLTDRDIVARGSIEQVVDNAYIKVPYIVGRNADDGTAFGVEGLNTEDDFDQFFEPFNFDRETWHEIKRLYPSGNRKYYIPTSAPYQFNTTIGLQWKRTSTLLQDLIFGATTRLTLQYWFNNTGSHPSTHSTPPIYTYMFDVISNGYTDYYAATHSSEFAYVFNNLEGYGYPGTEPPYFGPDPFANRPTSFKSVSYLMSRMWASFIHDHNPNYDFAKYNKFGNTTENAEETSQGVSVWPQYSPAQPLRYVFNANYSGLSYVDYENERSHAIQFLIDKYVKGKGTFGQRDNL